MRLFKLFVALDLKIRSAIHGAVDWVDGVFPFSRKDALATAISLYLFFSVWAFEKKEMNSLELICGLTAASLAWILNGRRGSNALTPLLAPLRILYALSSLFGLVAIFYGFDRARETSFILFTIVMYLDDEGRDRGHRRRLVDKLKSQVEGSGLATA